MEEFELVENVLGDRGPRAGYESRGPDMRADGRGLDKANTFIKKETLAQVFSVNFVEFFKNTSYKRTPVVAASVGKSLQGIISIIILS